MSRREFIGVTAAGVGLAAEAFRSKAEAEGVMESNKASLFPVPDWVYSSRPDTGAAWLPGEDHFRLLADYGATMVCTWALSLPTALALHRSRITHQDPEYAKKDPFADFARFKQKYGLRWHGYMTPAQDGWLVRQHPEWRVKKAPDEKLGPPDRWTFLCLLSPYGDLFIQKLVEITQQYPIDGFNFDGINYICPVCYCDSCRARYRKAANADLPLKVNDADPNFRRYLRWRNQEKIAYIHRLQSALKAVNPDIALMPWQVGPGRWWAMETTPGWNYEPEIVNLIADFPTLEMFWDWPLDEAGTVMPDFTLRYFAGLRRDRPFAPSPNWSAHGQQPTTIPETEVMYRNASIIAAGGIPAPNWWWAHRREDYRETMEMVRQRQPWTVRATSRKWAALVASENSRIFYGREQPRERYLVHCLGAFRAFQEDHLPFDIMTDLDMEEGGERLSAYKVIVLPNTACLSERALANLQRYVEQGGGLVATHESSLYDQDGQRRADFGLASLFGATYKAAEDHTSVWPNTAPDALGPAAMNFTEHPLLSDPVIDRSFAGNAPEGKTQRMTDFLGRALNVTASTQAHVIVTRTGVKSEQVWPALILSQPGKGRVAYFPNGMDDAYFRFPLAVQRRLLTNAARWAAGENRPPVEVVAPRCVSVTCFDQKTPQGTRLAVHLLNQTNTLSGRSLSSGTPPQREEMPPIADIRVHIRDKGISRVTQQPEGKLLPLQQKDDGVQVTVPLLQMHSILVAE